MSGDRGGRGDGTKWRNLCGDIPVCRVVNQIFKNNDHDVNFI
jgi:hypothetical protein